MNPFMQIKALGSRVTVKLQLLSDQSIPLLKVAMCLLAARILSLDMEEKNSFSAVAFSEE